MPSHRSLFEPINVGTMKLKNRIVLAPVATNFGDEGGRLSLRQLEYYIERAKGGVGLVVSESNYVSIEGRGGINRLGLDRDQQISEHRKLTKAIHKIGIPVCAQLHHGGGTVSVRAIAQNPVSCSSVSLLRSGESAIGRIPRRLSQEEVHGLVQKFADAARRAKEAGFDAVMIHAAHGYLINSFLSPRTNKRNDRYGGNDKNRARFLVEIARSIRNCVGPEFPIMTRMTGEELFEGGYRIDFIQKVAKWLEAEGVDEINISAGNYEEIERMVAPSSFPEGFLRAHAEALKKVLKIPVGVVGRVMSPDTADEIIRGGKADILYLGRALISDSEFVSKVYEARENEIRPCIVCNRGCIDRLFQGLDIRCSVNPVVGKELEGKILPCKHPRKVLVVGGGPAGMEAAKIAASRGHNVKLYDKADKLGGALRKAILLPHKEPISRLIDYYINQLKLLGVDITLNTEVRDNTINRIQPDVMIFATGAEPMPISIPGEQLSNVHLAEDCIKDIAKIGQSAVIVGGGLLGVEVAEALTDLGKQVVIIEQLDSVAAEAGEIIKKTLITKLCNKGVRIFVDTKVIAISTTAVIVERFGMTENITSESVIIAAGYKSNRAVTQKLDLKGVDFFVIGDAVKPRTIMQAIQEGNRVGALV